MFHRIYNRIEKEIPSTNEKSKDGIIPFFKFLYTNTQFITITSNIDMPHVFSVFESINSKGKPLDNIDKIKTYVFSELDEKDYAEYLDKWGKLILKTDDRLEEYLQIFIKAYFFPFCKIIY